jgi:hypothetical protein
LTAALSLLPILAAAAHVQVPLSLPLPFLESVLREQAFTGPGASARIGDDGSGCQYLVLRQPSLGPGGKYIKVRTDAEARLGHKVAGRCLVLTTWYGQLEFDQLPSVAADGKTVVLRTAGWRAFKPDGSPDSVSTTIGQWLDAYLPSRLKETRISIARPISQLEQFLTSMIGTDAAGSASSVLNGVRIDSALARQDSVAVTLDIEATPTAAPPRQQEAALSDRELAQLASRLDEVDAFFTYTIKSMADDTGADPTALLDVLVELRRDLIDILATRQRQATDPARTLFIDAWEGLSPLLRLAAEAGADTTGSLRYLTFLGAGDALNALEDLGPAAGIEISSDGLRRLARILLPDDPTDPLNHGEGVDPALRQSFGFGAPIPVPRYDAESSWLDWLIPRAVAASGLNPDRVKRLNNWVPRSADMDEYLPMVREVLSHVIQEQLRANPLDPDFHPVYRRLVYAAAWQESCWRQFVARDDMRVPVQSGTGDVGMMQINPKVWRGFYDLQGLRWDIVYNARAGADILQHHLLNYGIEKEEHRVTGSTDNLARAAYAAYNGGPRQYDRYRRPNAPAQAKKIDGLFRDKYQAVKQQGEMAVIACYGG